MPFWNEALAPAIKLGKRVAAAHVNSVRAIVKYLDIISDDDVVGLNIPHDIRLVYGINDALLPIRHYYLSDAEAAAKAVAAVAHTRIYSCRNPEPEPLNRLQTPHVNSLKQALESKWVKN